MTQNEYAASDSMQPLDYGMSLGNRIVCYAFIPIAIVMTHFAAEGREKWVIGTLMAIVAVYNSVAATFYGLKITADVVTFRGAVLTRSIRQQDIVGYSILRGNKGSLSLKVVTQDGGSLKIGMLFATDSKFDAWLHSIPRM